MVGALLFLFPTRSAETRTETCIYAVAALECGKTCEDDSMHDSKSIFPVNSTSQSPQVPCANRSPDSIVGPSARTRRQRPQGWMGL